MKNLIALLVVAIVLSACSSQNKKIVVMSKGEAVVNTDAGTISAKDGAGHNEKEAYAGGGKIAFKLSSPAGDAAVELEEPGLYVVNVKTDTILGSYQNYIDPKLAQNVMTQEVLRQKLDSLKLLSEGKNVSAANRNFFILPNHAVHITGNSEALVVGPYHQMRSAEKINGKDPEVYRFYSIKEVREMIDKLTVLTTPKKI
jgi:hypothetical protein